MDTVENDARGETFIGKGHANNTRLPGAHGGHCIEEVCNSAEPLVDCRCQTVGSRLAVTDRHPNSARSERLHKPRGPPFRRQSPQGRSECRYLPEPIQIVPSRGPDTVVPMNSRARAANKRT